MLNIPILARSFLVFSPGWTRLATTPLNKNKQAEPKERSSVLGPSRYFQNIKMCLLKKYCR
jgi:hypothetical protein